LAPGDTSRLRRRSCPIIVLASSASTVSIITSTVSGKGSARAPAAPDRLLLGRRGDGHDLGAPASRLLQRSRTPANRLRRYQKARTRHDTRTSIMFPARPQASGMLATTASLKARDTTTMSPAGLVMEWAKAPPKSKHVPMFSGSSEPSVSTDAQRPRRPGAGWATRTSRPPLLGGNPRPASRIRASLPSGRHRHARRAHPRRCPSPPRPSTIPAGWVSRLY
jgi:hypothetical protein